MDMWTFRSRYICRPSSVGTFNSTNNFLAVGLNWELSRPLSNRDEFCIFVIFQFQKRNRHTKSYIGDPIEDSLSLEVVT